MERDRLAHWPGRLADGTKWNGAFVRRAKVFGETPALPKYQLQRSVALNRCIEIVFTVIERGCHGKVAPTTRQGRCSCVLSKSETSGEARGLKS